MYVAYDRKIRRYSLPSMVWDQSWGYNWAGTNYEHSLIHLVADNNNIYAVGDTRYTSCASQSFQYRGYFDVYSRSTGQLLNYYYYEGANNQYDLIYFSHAVLGNNRLFVQGGFKQLNGLVRRNFACLDINTGAITSWQAGFPNTDINQSYFHETSDLKLYKGKIWLSSNRQTLSDASTFKGFGAIDTVTGNLFSQPLDIRKMLMNNNPLFYQTANDFIITDSELAIAGNFDTLNNSVYHNLAIYHLDGTNRTQFCPGGSATISSNITGTTYQWQMDSGTGFVNISNNSNFSGTQTPNLQLINIPSAWYGYQLRCNVDGAYSDLFKLEFSSTWTGAVSTAWENPANWSCGAVPEANTDVIINGGTVILSVNTTIRSLNLAPGVNFTVNPGVIFTVLH